MNKILGLGLGFLLLLGVACVEEEAAAQGKGRGSTPEGDILRGQGQFLRGAGWYELNSAKARNIDVKTWKSWNLETERLYTNFMIERSHRLQYRKNLTVKEQEVAKKKLAEDQRRWRESPNDEDIYSGDALNALASDLANPNILPVSWGSSQVALPPQLSLTALTFRIITKQGSNVVSVDRMLAEGQPPMAMRRHELEQETAAYKQAIATVTEKCRKETPIQYEDYVALRKTVKALEKKVVDVFPTSDKMKTSAKQFVRGLDESTKIFEDQLYAEQLIRDVSLHRATTVGELLAFMRQYRLLFDVAGDSRDVRQLYGTLYELLREQRDKLGPAPALAAAAEGESGPQIVKVPDGAIRMLEQARSTLQELKYPSAPKHRTKKESALADLKEALDDAGKGIVPIERLRKARQEVKELQKESTKKADHGRLLSEAMKQLDQALAILQIAPSPAEPDDNNGKGAPSQKPGRKAKGGKNKKAGS
jgi:hypothetical protein